MIELHKKYAPILRFNKNEHFFPMRIDDMLTYCVLQAKGERSPVVRLGELTPQKLAQHGQSSEVYIRSVERGPQVGRDVVEEWHESALEMVLRRAKQTSSSWSDGLAKTAYSWFSPKTKAATSGFWWNDLLVEVMQNAVKTAEPGDLPRLTLPLETRASAAGRYQASYKKAPAYTYYFYQLRDSGYFNLQYWFFYSYNDWGQGYAGFNDHEGDWESLHLFFKLDSDDQPQEPPAYISYATHESRITKEWDHPDVERVGTHPVGYVGAGSHATYPQAKAYPVSALYGLVDYATGDGLTIDHDQWTHGLHLSDLTWLTNYQGSWGTRYWLSTAQAKTILRIATAAIPLVGLASWALDDEIDLPGVSAPHGPVGSSREQSTNPVKWAGIAPQLRR